MTTSAALLRRLDERRSLLMAHLAMLEEATERGEPWNSVQLDLIHSEMFFLADLYRTMYLSVIEADLTRARSEPCNS